MIRSTRASTGARVLGGFAALVALFALLPEAAAACPVCFDSSDENRLAFLATTVFLSLLPLGLVGGAGLWIRKRSKEAGDDGQGPDRPEG